MKPPITTDDFYQLVRKYELALNHNKVNQHWVGYDGAPAEEKIRFHEYVGMSYPHSSVMKGQDLKGRHHIDIAFMGLTKALPNHYRDTMLARLKSKDQAMKAFFDVFTHRFASFYYRAWKKYRPETSIEDGEIRNDIEDHYQQVLTALSSAPSPDHLYFYYAGHFSRKTRSSDGLKNILMEYLQVQVTINEFQGNWLRIQESERSKLQLGSFNQLNSDVILGRYTWDAQSKFSIEIGEVGIELFNELMPGMPKNERVQHIVKSYVGSDMLFDFMVKIKQSDCPRLKLNDRRSNTVLGLSTWLGKSEEIDKINKVIFASNDAE